MKAEARPQMRSRMRARFGRRLRISALAALLVGPVASAAGQREIVGLAIVQDDGSLLIKEQPIELYGIYLPDTERQCRAWQRPVRCAPRAALALDFRVRGFVTCEVHGRSAAGRIRAICHVDRTGLKPGEDLGAYLIRHGWALALPDAPFEYQAMERIARAKGLGVWGTAVDAVGPP
jgi:endonuclease YncB( thermonuclease family)